MCFRIQALVFTFLLTGAPVLAQSSTATAGQAQSGSEIQRLIRQGDHNFNTGRYPSALTDYQQALRRARQLGHTRAVCDLLNNLAALAMAQGDQANFQKVFSQARDCFWSGEKSPAASRPTSGNLLLNSGFEDGLAHPWGTGHYETSLGRSRFGVWWNSLNAQAFMKIDTDQRHSGEKSLRITNYSPSAPHVFVTTSQRLMGLQPNTVYRLSLYARAENLKRGATCAVDAAWGKRPLVLPPGTYDWTPFSATVNIGHNDYIDLRIIVEDTGTVWVDDLAVELAQDPTGLQAQLQQAESLYDRAQFPQALALYQELSLRHPDQIGVLLQIRYQTGRIHLALGQYDEARRDFRWLAEKRSRLAPLGLGDLYYQLGEFDRAQEQYHQALALYKGDQGTLSRIQEKLAATFLAQGHWDQAFAAQRQSLHIQRHIGDLHGQALALHTTGLLYLLQKDSARALEPLATAAKLARQLNDPRLLASALINQGEAQFQQGHRNAALKSVQEGLRLAQSVGDPRSRLQALYLRSRCHRQTGTSSQALADFRQAMLLLQELYANLGVTPRETRQSFLNQFVDLYRDYIDLLLELYQHNPQPEYLHEAFQRSEEARARLFTEMVNEVRAAQAFAATSRDPDLGRLLIREREASFQLEAVRRQHDRVQELPLAQRQSGKDVALLEQELNQALAVSQQLQEEIQMKFPRYNDLKNPRPLKFQDIQALLQPDEAVLSYFVTSRRTGLFALDRERLELKVLPLGRQAMREQVRTFLQGIQSLDGLIEENGPNRQTSRPQVQTAVAAFNLSAAHSLYQQLVAPVSGVLAGKRLVFLAPDDLLYLLPFEALLTAPPNPATSQPESVAHQFALAPYWILQQSLSYLPSLSVLRSLRTLAKSPPSPQVGLVAFADPVFEASYGTAPAAAATRRDRLHLLRSGGAFRTGQLSPLPDTAEEARRAAQALGGRPEDVYLQERATEGNLKRLPLASYRHILFATHGLMAGEFRPGLQPALALSFVGDPDNDGLLEMGEILGLDLQARLVVLSACNTARSSAPEDRGEGFAGLTRSFMYAGASSLVVTLWSVESESAMRLMGNFYGRLPDRDRALALADAKRAMIAGRGSLPLGPDLHLPLAHPFFWAPYIMVGEGR